MSEWKRCNLYQNHASFCVSSSSVSKLGMSFLLLWAFCLCIALALPTVLLGQVDIWVFFTTKLLWWSSDFPSACMKWKAYQDLPIESQQNVYLWYQWAYAFFEFVHFQLDCLVAQEKKKLGKISNIAVLTAKKWTFFQRETPTFLFLLPARNYPRSLSLESTRITDWASREFELTLQNFLLWCGAVLPLYLLLTQFFYSKTWKSFPLEGFIIVCFGGEQRFSNSVEL